MCRSVCVGAADGSAWPHLEIRGEPLHWPREAELNNPIVMALFAFFAVYIVPNVFIISLNFDEAVFCIRVVNGCFLKGSVHLVPLTKPNECSCCNVLQW